MADLDKTIRGGLTEGEWYELLSLEYVITWHYTDDSNRDTARLLELRIKRHGSKDHCLN